ncbi:MaoC/PaaZ C-terminal domain-containing protein [Streptomyces sp. SPB162]|uniref:MaoC family dehydratase n=1 Tax=Streptomyces sp. SPB162 TaxID=2940560 RepID=UPI00240608D3|nr:MaoC/PaaZ C-terminal domain-containing protein [Streptomyces sp. SPB162]MDF9814910.1 acyl dehydratase [Streptomyces sp. SPB162]
MSTRTRTLAAPPRLPLVLAKGAIGSRRKRGRPRDGAAPTDRLVLPAVRVDPERLAAYARVCGFTRERPADAAPGAVPLTYPHILGFPLAAQLMADPAFPLPLLGLVHTSIEITQRRALRAADRPELTVHTAALRPHHRGTEAVLVTEARLDGELVWSDRSTYLARHSGATGPRPDDTSEPKGSRLPAVATWQLGADLGRRHARVSGDYNPIHLHPWTAKPLGFPRAIAHGMWTVARCAAEAVPAAAEHVTLHAGFRAPVLLPGTVTYAACGTAEAGARFELRSGDRVHLTGEVVPSDGRS